ncbi:hypothetical protein [Microbacterium phyllosphaerae]|uniref:hypothetical protein n=1 Tax=Microbacterium phyllosphaerae TaxID=124798 RepID=UPI003D6584A3
MTNTYETEPAGVARLREARERLAAAREQTEAASAAAPLPVVPGDTFHAVLGGCTISTGAGFMASAHITRAGENIIVTQKMIDASFSASGRSWMALLGDDGAQVERWGAVRFRLGQAPADAPTWNNHGDVEWTRARKAAKAEAWAHPTAEARAAALAAVNERFGPLASTATYWVQEDPFAAAAAAQQKALDEGGIRFSQHVEAREAGVKGERR